VPPGGVGAGGNAAKETFLNYFFGGNGPGPISAASLERNSLHLAAAGQFGAQAQNVGRDISGADPMLQTGLLAGKRDGNSAALDMKSLGKHIEAVRHDQALEPLCPANDPLRHPRAVAFSCRREKRWRRR
jgi:dynamin 1-like protein